MSIASEVQRIKNNVASAYTACSGKGATMPQTQNSASLADCIDSITSGGGYPTNNLTPQTDVIYKTNANGTIIGVTDMLGRKLNCVIRDINGTLTLENIKNSSGNNIGLYATDYSNVFYLQEGMAWNYYYEQGLNEDLVFISVPYATKLSNFLTYLGDSDEICIDACWLTEYPNIKALDYSGVTTVGGEGCWDAFQSGSLEYINLDSLNSVDNTSFYRAFYSFNNTLSDVYFPSITSNSFVNTEGITQEDYGWQDRAPFSGEYSSNDGVTWDVKLHFPSNLVDTWWIMSYINQNSLIFDLPATT